MYKKAGRTRLFLLFTGLTTWAICLTLLTAIIHAVGLSASFSTSGTMVHLTVTARSVGVRNRKYR